MASKTAGAAEKMNEGSVKMEDMTEKMEDVAKKWKTIGKEDGGCGGEDGGCGGEDGRCDGEDGGCGGEDGGCGGEDGGCGEEDGGCLRQICANVAGRRDKGCATFCASGRCANGLKTNCLEWQKTRRWPPFLPKNAAKMKKKRTERIDFTNNRITLYIINIGATYNQYRRAYKRNKQNCEFLALYQQTASTNKETENN